MEDETVQIDLSLIAKALQEPDSEPIQSLLLVQTDDESKGELAIRSETKENDWGTVEMLPLSEFETLEVETLDEDVSIELRWTPWDNWFGEVKLKFKGMNGFTLTQKTAIVTIQIHNSLEPPRINIRDYFTLFVGQILDEPIHIENPDNVKLLGLQVSNQPKWITLNKKEQKIEGKAPEEAKGSSKIKIQLKFERETDSGAIQTKKVTKEIEVSVIQTVNQDQKKIPRLGEVYVRSEDLIYNTEEMYDQVMNYKETYDIGIDELYGLGLRTYNDKLITIVKPSTQLYFHSVQAFLKGTIPFEITEIWQAHQYIAERMKYTRDNKLFNYEEIWQTSEQSLIKLRGDCEDHAILLVDWLVMAGHQAYVECGDVNFRGEGWGGHCWVVVVKEGVEYLIESTAKREWHQYKPVTKEYIKRYRPEYRFDHSDFFMNYQGAHEYPEWEWINTFN